MKTLLLLTALFFVSVVFALTHEDLEKTFINTEVLGYCPSREPFHLNENRIRQLNWPELYLSGLWALMGGKKYFQVGIFESIPGTTQCYRGTVIQLLRKIAKVTAQHEKIRRDASEVRQFLESRRRMMRKT